MTGDGVMQASSFEALGLKGGEAEVVQEKEKNIRKESLPVRKEKPRQNFTIRRVK